MKSSILFILHLPPPVHGAAMMGKYIQDSQLINNSFDCHFINLATANSLQDIGKYSFRKLWSFCKLLISIVKNIKQYQPDLVYVTPNSAGAGFYKDFIVVQLIKVLGCKVIAHYHNQGISTKQNKKIDNFLYKTFFKNIKVILLSDFLYQDVSKYICRENVYICSNGIPDFTINLDNYNHHNPTPHLLFLSNLLKDKGVFVLLDALEELKNNGSSFKCTFVGSETNDINKQLFYKEVNRRNLADIVIYKGSKFGDKKIKEYMDADLFVFPSLKEAFPLVILEAMQVKLPIIASKVGGVPTEVKDGVNGLLVTPGNHKELALKISILLKDMNLRKQMGENSYTMFKENFTLSHFERNVMKCITTEITNNNRK